jgi:crossover junction endodeoxyribonuclease RuvC
MGWGMIQFSGGKLFHVGNGTLESDEEEPLATRLAALHRGLEDILATHVPDCAAVEATFVNADAAGALKLGQARAVALVVPALAGLAVAEYAPNMVKKALVGVGHAEKSQVRAMVSRLLPRAEIASDDAADALALAICHAHMSESRTAVRLRVVGGASA